MGHSPCHLCGKPANQSGSHVISHLLINDILSNNPGNHRNDGILFGISSSGDVKHEIGRAVLPAKIEELFSNSEKVIKDNSNLTTFDYVFCSNCEKAMSELESLSKIILDKSKSNSSSLGKEEQYELFLFFILQIWRSSVVSLMGFELDAKNKSRMKELLSKRLIQKDNAEIHETIVIFKLKKSSKTGGLLFLTSGTQSPYYFVFDDMAIAYFHKSRIKQIMPFYGLEHKIKKSELGHSLILVKDCDNDLSSSVYSGLNNKLVKLRIKGWTSRILAVLKSIGIKGANHSMAEVFLGNGMRLLKNEKFWTEEQVFYCVLVANNIMPEDENIRSKLF